MLAVNREREIEREKIGDRQTQRKRERVARKMEIRERRTERQTDIHTYRWIERLCVYLHELGPDRLDVVVQEVGL